jgi:hypothetical protein
MGPHFILSSVRVAFLHLKPAMAKCLVTERRLPKFKIFGSVRPGGSNPRHSQSDIAPLRQMLYLYAPGVLYNCKLVHVFNTGNPVSLEII